MERFWIRNIREGIVFHSVRNVFLIQFVFDEIMTVEIEFTGKGHIRGYFQIARASYNNVVEVDVVMLDRFYAFVELLKLFSIF